MLTSEVVVCAECSAQNPARFDYCGHCRKPLNGLLVADRVRMEECFDCMSEDRICQKHGLQLCSCLDNECCRDLAPGFKCRKQSVPANRISLAIKFLRCFNGAHDDWADEIEGLRESLRQAVATIEHYLSYKHDGDPWTEDARAMGEMDINDYAKDGRLTRAKSLLEGTPGDSS